MSTASISAPTASSPIGPLPSGKKDQVRFAAQELESVMIAHMLKESHGQPNKFFGNSMASNMFKDMMDEELSHDMAKAGAFGLANTIEKSMDARVDAQTAATTSTSKKA